MEYTLEEIESDLKTAKELVEFGEAIKRLNSNKDFKTVILEGYLKDNAIRLVHLRADAYHQSPERQASILSQLDGIGGLNDFLGTKLHFADMAVKKVQEIEETIEEMSGED